MTSHSERIVGLYQRHAAAWDQLRCSGSFFEQPWLDKFLALVPGCGSILDLGCGAGLPISGYLIRQGRAVTGIDSSPQLIELCRRRFPHQQWIVADMRTLNLDHRYDGILAWNSFFHLSPDDQTSMFSIFARHAAPNAPLMFTCGPAHGEVCGEFVGEPLYHASLDPAEYAAWLDKTGFEAVEHVADDPACGRHSIWLARATSPQNLHAPTSSSGLTHADI